MHQLSMSNTFVTVFINIQLFIKFMLAQVNCIILTDNYWYEQCISKCCN